MVSPLLGSELGKEVKLTNKEQDIKKLLNGRHVAVSAIAYILDINCLVVKCFMDTWKLSLYIGN